MHILRNIECIMIKISIIIISIAALIIFWMFAKEIDRIVEFSCLILLFTVVVLSLSFFLGQSLFKPMIEENQVKKVIKITFIEKELHFAEIITVSKFDDYYIDERGDYYYFVRSYTNSNGAVAQLIKNKSVKLFEMNNQYALQFLSKPQIDHLEV